MTKTKKPSRAKRLFQKKTLATIAITFVCTAIFASVYYISTINSKDDPTTLREILISSLENLKYPAPVEPKTGDVYFPDAKLFVPKQHPNVNLTYSYDDYQSESTPANPVLSISTSQLINELSSELYNAQNSRELFDKLPHLQACQRGVSIAAHPITDDSEVKLHHEKKVADGRNLYIYTDKNCHEAGRIIDALQDLQSY